MAYSPIRSAADLASRLIANVTTEDDWMEFKGPIPYPGKSDVEDRAECALDIAQFANASGGVLVIGAEENNHVLHALVSVKDPTRLNDWIKDVVLGQLRPVPVFEPLLISTTTATTCLVVNVPPHPTLVARYKDKKYQFVVRAGTGKRYLEMDELEARMQGQERLMRHRLEKVPRDAQVGLDVGIRELSHNGWRIVGVDDDVVRFAKADAPAIEAIVPLAYVGAVYPAHEANADWVVHLSCYIAQNRKTGRIHVTRNVPGGMIGEFRHRGLD